ncbi:MULTISPECIES: KxYKxGKxW signal peptide domain-containing protein [Streptococcus]|uniref:KxYKxGKxW signal peptide domain-containing protein n=1 Tax=Streptococcus TaxID=1301 RepID=UPI00187D03C6|nr:MULTISPECIES: KxYKxGKxW signal peptide domain-containing protein [Streptococcus]MBE7885315.1 KxYKxGKxW signal peptide domain-containing protein [Streptococcus salivarius]MDN5038660.1 KxYKxGKxW signal peptide domain-containing protein [Streptococcus sp. SS9]MDU3251082.1 KxYKxGKxW signal peptide domain-containing protein [Streptococcus salivarius]
MEKKVYFKLHKVKKQWVTIAVTSLALGLSFASLGYVSAAEQTHPTTEPTVENSIEENAIDVISSSTNEVTTKPEEDKSFVTPNTREIITETTSTESKQSVTDTATSDIGTSEINSQQALRSEVSTVTSSEVVSSETSHSETNAAHEVEERPVISGGHYTSDDQGNWYYIKDGKALTGMQNIDNVAVYFDADGKQVKGDTRHVNGSTYHFEKDSGQLTRNAFASDKNGNWYYLGHDGKALTGSQVIDNITLYFYPNGVQAKDAFVILDGNSYYFQKDTGQLVRDRFWSDDDGNWYYSDKEGKLLTGEQTIDGFDMYFYPDGVQAKGEIVTIGIEPYYFDKDSGHKVINTDITINGKTYHAEANGLLIETEQKLPQRPLVSGGHFQEDSSGNWYYYTATGEKLKGWQNVDGVTLYFDEEGRQAKDGERIIDGSHYYFSHYSGAVKTNYWHTWSIEIRRQEPFAKTYYEYYGSDGRRYYGWHRVGDQLYYFDHTGRVENGLTIFKGQNYLFDNHGKLVKDAFYIQSLRVFVGTLNTSYRSNKFGQVLTGEHHINGDDYYFSNSGSPVTDIVEKGGKDYYYFEGKLLKNYLGPLLKRQELDYDAYYSGIVGTDKDGVLLTGVSTANNGKLYYFENNRNIPKMFTVTTPTWKTIDGKLYHLEPSINRTYKHGGRSYTATVREEVDIINHGVRTKTDKIKRIIDDDFGNLYYLDENNDFYIGHLLPENTDLTKIEETVIQSDNKFYAFNRTSSLSETSPLTVSKTLVYNKKAYLIDDKGVATETKLTNRFEHDDAWNWYYFDNEGKAVTGLHSIDNVTLYFDKEGKQAKGRLVEIDGQTHYFDRDSGAMWTNRTLELNGIRYVIDQNGYVTMNKPGQFIQDKDGDWAYIKENGQLATGLQIINHQKYYFDPTGKQAKGKRLLLDGKYYFFDNDTGAMFVNKFHETGDYFSKKYTYFGEDGSQIFGWATIEGKRVYFKEDGYQVRNDRHKIGDFDYFFKKDGSMLSDDIDGDYKYYYADKDGHLQFGWVTHNNETYYISPPWGAENRTYLQNINEKTYLLGPKGRLLRNTATDISWDNFCVSDENGVVKTGVIRLEDNRLYYFNPEIYMTTPFSGEWAEFDGKLYHFEMPISVSPYSKGSPITTNTTLEKDGKTYIIDENGVATEKKD